MPPQWGLNGWSEALRQELQPDVRVMVIEPGAVATELTDHINHPDAKQAAEHMYKELAITADDIAEARVRRHPAAPHDAQRDPGRPAASAVRPG